MKEQLAESAEEYIDFIKKAFIDPIRTVVVVDDEFPSLDGLIQREQSPEPKKPWNEADIERVSKILNVCRQPDRHWFVDIHDAETVSLEDEKQFAPHLHQTDLMILDYHLEGNDGNGTKAIELLRLMGKNDHFNLVIVYTQGYDQAAGTIDQVVHEIALGLMSPDDDLNLSDKATDILNEALEEWEDDDPEIMDRLKDAIDVTAYLKIRKPDVKISQWHTLPEFGGVMAILEEKPENVKLEAKLVLKWLISEKQKALSDKLNQEQIGVVSYNPSGEGANWVRSERLFVTVVSKNVEPDQLTNKLIDALQEWGPHPYRLIMSKMRAELNEKGGYAEEAILKNRHLEMGWLNGLLNSEDDERACKIKTSIKNHWDSLGEGTHDKVESFAKSLAVHLSSVDFKSLIKKFNLIEPDENQNEIKKHINAFNCSKRVEGFHLKTGHVLEMEKDNKKEFWICLSPACDLVPGQKETGWKENLGETLPFKAVKLFRAKLDKAILKATRNNHLFLTINESIQIFSFTPTGDTSSNPVWEQMFAANNGRFEFPNCSLKVGRVLLREEGLIVKNSDFFVVAELRYEYALNLLQRLGGALSRVGLDFEGA